MTLGHDLGRGGPRNDGVDGDWGARTEAALFDALGLTAMALEPAHSPVLSTKAGKFTVPGLPRQYQWLADLGDQLPRLVWEGLHDYGVKEVPGPGNNPVILRWAAEVGLQRIYTADATPFCGLWMAAIVKRSGRDPVKDPLWALNWAKWGVDAGQPALGDILTFTRDGGGHVALAVAEDSTHYHVLGANQLDAVNIMRIEKKRLYRARRPVYKNQPASVRPYIIGATGLTSTNEA